MGGTRITGRTLKMRFGDSGEQQPAHDREGDGVERVGLGRRVPGLSPVASAARSLEREGGLLRARERSGPQVAVRAASRSMDAACASRCSAAR